MKTPHMFEDDPEQYKAMKIPHMFEDAPEQYKAMVMSSKKAEKDGLLPLYGGFDELDMYKHMTLDVFLDLVETFYKDTGLELSLYCGLTHDNPTITLVIDYYTPDGVQQ